MTDTLDYIFKQPCQHFRGRWLQKQWYSHNTCKLFYKIKPWLQHRSHIPTSSLKPTFSFKTPAKVCFAIASLTKAYLNNDNCPWLSPQHSSPSRAALVLQFQRLWAPSPCLSSCACGAAPSGRWTLHSQCQCFPLGLPHSPNCFSSSPIHVPLHFILPVYNGTVGISVESKSLPYWFAVPRGIYIRREVVIIYWKVVFFFLLLWFYSYDAMMFHVNFHVLACLRVNSVIECSALNIRVFLRWIASHMPSLCRKNMGFGKTTCWAT